MAKRGPTTKVDGTQLSAVHRVRCAIYTRKSTEEGLDQEFNSLDAQREACAAYIVSQRHEGWTLVPSLYDDGGYSGGTMNRPALKQLLADVDESKVDVIVVYKVDRLKADGRDYVIWCSDLPGFGCRVRASGSKSFIVQYRLGGRNSTARKVTIGACTKLTADDARKAAAKVLAKAELGEAVAAERARKRAEMTVAQLCDEYIGRGCVAKKDATLSTDKGRIERHIKPLLGRRRIGDVRRGDVEAFLNDVANGSDRKLAKLTRGQIALSLALELTSNLLSP